LVVTSRDVTFDEEKIVESNAPESQSANIHPSLNPSVITNVTTPPPGPISTNHVDHPHVNVPPIISNVFPSPIFSKS